MASENFFLMPLETPQKSHFGQQNVFALA